MKFFGHEEEDELKVDMTPLIDCVFQLIIFFLVATSFIRLEQDLSINLPVMSREPKPQKAPARPIVVNVRYIPGGEAYYHVDNEKMSLPALTISLSRARVRDKDQAVIIRGDRRVKWEHVAAVMGCCAQAGITKVAATVEISERK